MNSLVKLINPTNIKLNENEKITFENVNFKNKISKYHQVTFFMSKIGEIILNIFQYRF